MATQQPHITTLIIPQERKKPMNLKGLIASYLYHWPLFVTVLFVTVAVAIVYIQFAKPVYEINATLIIKDNKKAPEQQSALSEIDLVNSSKLIENEIEVLKSNRLISEVVKELELGIVYQKKDGLKVTDLYKSGPVKLIVLKPAGSGQALSSKSDEKDITIIIKDKNSFFLKKGSKQLIEYAFDKPVTNGFGTWKLEPTDFLPEYRGATIKIAILDSDQLTLQYQKAIDITIPNKLATAISLTLEDQVAQRGKDILNQLIADYNRFGTDENELKAKSTLAFLDKRIDSLHDELSIAEAGIEGYKSSRGLTDISTESKINLENIQDVDRSLNEVNIKLSVINGIENYVNSSKSGEVPATIGITDPALNSLIENLSRLKLQRSSLLAISPETNPDFDPINRQIATTKAAIEENVASIKSSLLNTRSKLMSFRAGLESSIKKIPKQERELASITRQQAVKEGLYTYLLQKREEIAANYADISTASSVVDHAYASEPKDKKAIALTIAIFLGLGLPFGIIFLRNNLNDTIIDVHEIKEVLETPIIGEISLEKSQDPISVNSTETSLVSEQLRTLRTNLYYLYGNKTRGRVTLVTSSVPEEGKSFISTNLGLTLSLIGRKTVLLKMVLRQSNAEDAFNVNNGPGISEYLNSKASLEEIVNPSDQNPNLHIIGSGAAVSNPSELLESGRLKDLVNALQNSYDDIIIDSPSVHLVPDALILSRLTDITLYIIKQGYTEKTELGFIKELVEKKQLFNVHIIFNGIQKAKYGYGYNYKNSYYSKSARKTIFTDFWKRF
nr:polysaccharide biosynthesis tyrosine autokinase [uncultured Pedobacter sp.]